MSEDTKGATAAAEKPPAGKGGGVSQAFSRLGEIVIEMGDDRNRRFLYAPTGQELRGWWKKANLIGMTMDQRMTQMPDLPGMYICLDCKRARLRVLDPLNAPENKGLLAQAQAVHKDVFRTNAGPETDKLEEGLNDTRLKTNLYWMRRLVDSGSARIVSGELPTLEQIETLPGMTRAEVWNSSARARKYREEPDEDVASRNQAARTW
jgi:hypothetical protein